MASLATEKALTTKNINPIKGLEYMTTVCGSVQKSGSLARALCALDQSRVGVKMAFTYVVPFHKGPDLTGIVVPTVRGWIAIDVAGNVLGVCRTWSATELYNNEEFLVQFKRVLLAGMPAHTFAKILDQACSDNAKATALWQNLRRPIDEGLEAVQPED